MAGRSEASRARRALIGCAWVWLILAWCAPAWAQLNITDAQPQAQEPPTPQAVEGASKKKATPAADEPVAPEGARTDGKADPEVKTRKAQTVSNAEVSRRMRDYIGSNNKRVTVYQIVEEMVDDLIADTRDLNIAAVSPIAIRNVGLTPNLSRAFGDWVEGQVENALVAHSDIRVKKCFRCRALRTRIDGDDWIVSLGLSDQEALAREGKRLGVVAFMDVNVAFVPGANVVSMTVQMYRAADGKILWSESYRSDATTAAILRSGDRVLTRSEARKELVRKIEQRPYYGYQVMAGFGLIPYDSPTAKSISGVMIGGRLYEKWGDDKRFLYGFHGESFINIGQNSLLGAFLGATVQYQINQPNLNDPTYRVGGLVQGFIAGTEGNSFALEANFETILQFRYGASVGVFYFFPTKFANYDLGGPGFKARFLLNW